MDSYVTKQAICVKCGKDCNATVILVGLERLEVQSDCCGTHCLEPGGEGYLYQPQDLVKPAA